jgi:hypothetical protein
VLPVLRQGISWSGRAVRRHSSEISVEGLLAVDLFVNRDFVPSGLCWPSSSFGAKGSTCVESDAEIGDQRMGSCALVVSGITQMKNPL